MFKLVVVSAPDEPKTGDRSPNDTTEKAPEAGRNKIALLGFREPATGQPDTEDEIDDDAAHRESEKGAKSA